MRVLVHTGMPKAGSSAIQAYLAHHRGALAAQGIDYPDYGHRGHWPLAAAFVKNPRKYHHARRRDGAVDVGALVQTVRDSLSETLRAGSSRLLILSHEDLCVEATLRKLDEQLKEHGYADEQVIYLNYLRHPVPLYASAVQQALKSGSDRSYLPSEWVTSTIQRGEKAVALLGDRFVIRPFAPPTKPSWDIIEDFRTFCRDALDVDLPERAGDESVNSSLSAEACAILELARGRFQDPDLSRSIRQAIRNFDGDWAGAKLAPPRAWLSDIAGANGPRWNALLPAVDTDPATRQALQIDAPPPQGQYRDDDLHEWLVSGLRSEWVEAFSKSDSLTRVNQGKRDAVIAWLKDLSPPSRDRERPQS